MCGYEGGDVGGRETFWMRNIGTEYENAFSDKLCRHCENSLEVL